MEVAGNKKRSASGFDDEHPSLSSSSSYSVSVPMKRSTPCRCNRAAEAVAAAKYEFAESYDSYSSSEAAKSERIARLKSRFAETISRAQRTLLLADQKKMMKNMTKNQTHVPHETQMISSCDNINYLEFKKAANKEKNKKNRREYLEIKRSNQQQQQQQQQQREAARKAINSIQKTVEFNDNVYVMNEFHKLIGLPPHVPH
ncbi:hypothetical protein FNV43_RR25037 [Rhamnella rubrinervis]|uniref:Uncharacterized protein n=1 Tax=Rhamnella rubrinervis TaxID=2594499 RepID=A0A8K0DTG4_9ROSA|nr:hypothetical protein FNV43_RR25037 [Rhamnella rubrinervis]